MEVGSYNSIKPEVETYAYVASLFKWANSTRSSKSTPSKTTGIKCAFCEESHVDRECWKYPDVPSKLNVVIEKKTVFKLFR